MKHLCTSASMIRRVLQRARTIVIVGASPSPDRHSHTVTRYLASQGYDVVPVRADRTEVAGLAAYATLAEVPGPIDLVVLYRTPSAVPAHIAEAAARQVEVVWLPPGVWSQAVDAAASEHGVTIIKERCIMEEHRRLAGQSGHPPRWGVHLRRRKPTYEDNRVRPEESGYSPAGGGGHAAGGGGRSVLDEKKMLTGSPSRRRGVRKPRGQ